MSSAEFAEPALSPIPLELVIQIASQVARPDLARLLRVNTFFHKACVKLLYTEVHDVAAFNTSLGLTYRYPPLQNTCYAEHVRCLEVRAKPHTCCDLPRQPLPGLEVLRLEYRGLNTDVQGVPRFISAAAAYDAQTLVICSPSTLREDAAPASDIASKLDSAHLVLLFREVKLERLLGATLGTYTPRKRHSLTIVLHFEESQPKQIIDTLLTLCKCLANTDQPPLSNHRLQRVCFVIGGTKLTRRGIQELLKSLNTHMAGHRAAAKETRASASNPTAPAAPSEAGISVTPAPGSDTGDAVESDEVLPPPAIELLLMSEYLRDQRSRYVFSELDIRKHYDNMGRSKLTGPSDIRRLVATHVDVLLLSSLLDSTLFSSPGYVHSGSGFQGGHPLHQPIEFEQGDWFDSDSDSAIAWDSDSSQPGEEDASDDYGYGYGHQYDPEYGDGDYDDYDDHAGPADPAYTPTQAQVDQFGADGDITYSGDSPDLSESASGIHYDSEGYPIEQAYHDCYDSSASQSDHNDQSEYCDHADPGDSQDPEDYFNEDDQYCDDRDGGLEDYLDQEDDFVEEEDDCLDQEDDFVDEVDDFVDQEDDFVDQQDGIVDHDSDFLEQEDDLENEQDDYVEQEHTGLASEDDFVQEVNVYIEQDNERDYSGPEDDHAPSTSGVSEEDNDYVDQEDEDVEQEDEYVDQEDDYFEQEDGYVEEDHCDDVGYDSGGYNNGGCDGGGYDDGGYDEAVYDDYDDNDDYDDGCDDYDDGYDDDY